MIDRKPAFKKTTEDVHTLKKELSQYSQRIKKNMNTLARALLNPDKRRRELSELAIKHSWIGLVFPSDYPLWSRSREIDVWHT